MPITNFTDGTETVESREKDTDGTETADLCGLYFSTGACGFFFEHARWRKSLRVLGMLRLITSMATQGKVLIT